MSIYPLALPGWDDLSTWGQDDDYFFAQLTRNGHPDDDGPGVWITPPGHPAYPDAPALGRAISAVTGVDEAVVLRAMSVGVPAPALRAALRLPEPRSGAGGRHYLDVPFSEKDNAKAAGARWDPDARRWFDPRPPTSALQRWTARPDVPEVLPGEDRTFGAGLFVDLVPRSCWFTNVRSCVAEPDWERLRRPILRRAGYRCEVCGAPADGPAGAGLEVHERWHYDDRAGVQALRRLLAICRPCHLTTHLGYSSVTGRADEAFAHLLAVTGMNATAGHAHVRAAEEVWLGRSARTWTLDLGMLTAVGISLRRPEPAATRPGIAEQALDRAAEPAGSGRRRGWWARITGA